MKDVAAVTVALTTHLGKHWHTSLQGLGSTTGASAGSGAAPRAPWPWEQALGSASATKAELEANFAVVLRSAAALHAYAARPGVSLRTVSRKVHGTRQDLPTHVVIADIDTAAAVCGRDWVDRLQRGRARLEALQAEGFTGDLTRVVRTLDASDDVEFDLLVTVADFFRAHPDAATGLTPRQVPIPGVHAKWLNHSQGLVAALAGLPGLDLAENHPSRIHFTYLDPDHLRAGGRRHDSASVGDTAVPAYRPSVVLVSENKDTAVNFPKVPGGIAVEGAGFGGRAAAAITWLRECPDVVYWGDLDADGLTILNGYRAAGVDARSILMDVNTYERYARFGTNLNARNGRIPLPARQELPELGDDERALYLLLTDPAFTGHRRLEQERIPLAVALAALHAAAPSDRRGTRVLGGTATA